MALPIRGERYLWRGARAARRTACSEIRVFCESLVGRAYKETERAYGASFDERVRDTIDLMEHNETVVGLENLLGNLADFEIDLSADERVALEGFILAFGAESGSPLAIPGHPLGPRPARRADAAVQRDRSRRF